MLKGIESETYVVTSGVSQGSHLGYLSFVVHIDDVINCFYYPKLLFHEGVLKYLPILRQWLIVIY